jgi:uncharacterized membrane protein
MDYTYFKLIHVLAVVIFLGNIITGLFWMNIAVKTKDLKIIAFTMKGIIQADRYFTIPGVVIITTGGILAAVSGHFPLFRTGWIFWSIILFSISGLVFAFKVAPLQKKIYHLTMRDESSGSFDWTDFRSMYRAWDLWGLIAVLTPIAAFVMMILKVPQ